MVRHAVTALTRRVRAFREDLSGTSAVEFAFILPVMVVLYFGCVEISQAVSLNRKVTAASSAAGDLVAQASVITAGEMDDIIDATEAIIAPYPIAPLETIVSSVWINEDGDASVIWSCAENATKRAAGSPVEIPEDLLIPETSLIMAEIDYVYVSPFSDLFGGSVPLGEVFYLRPRKVSAVGGPADC